MTGTSVPSRTSAFPARDTLQVMSLARIEEIDGVARTTGRGGDDVDVKRPGERGSRLGPLELEPERVQLAVDLHEPAAETEPVDLGFQHANVHDAVRALFRTPGPGFVETVGNERLQCVRARVRLQFKQRTEIGRHGQVMFPRAARKNQEKKKPRASSDWLGALE